MSESGEDVGWIGEADVDYLQFSQIGVGATLPRQPGQNYALDPQGSIIQVSNQRSLVFLVRSTRCVCVAWCDATIFCFVQRSECDALALPTSHRSFHIPIKYID
jgi:hypothetical protein